MCNNSSESSSSWANFRGERILDGASRRKTWSYSALRQLRPSAKDFLFVSYARTEKTLHEAGNRIEEDSSERE
jgi:hypothetical protein